ncbi:MAG: SPOR domain-containing protein, partial [Pseudomonadota bacterium]
MAQARRKPAKRSRPGSSVHLGNALQGLTMLCAGIVIGSLATILWQGTRSDDDGVGAGIREMIQQSRDQSQNAQSEQDPAPIPPAEPQKTQYDFFTVLPEIEVVVPEKVEEQKPEATTEDIAGQQKNDTNLNPVAAVDSAPIPSSSYMLQAGSYQRESDAERLKATLALKGLVSSIQKVSIQGRGDFYRVRLG